MVIFTKHFMNHAEVLMACHRSEVLGACACLKLCALCRPRSGCRCSWDWLSVSDCMMCRCQCCMTNGIVRRADCTIFSIYHTVIYNMQAIVPATVSSRSSTWSACHLFYVRVLPFWCRFGATCQGPQFTSRAHIHLGQRSLRSPSHK